MSFEEYKRSQELFAKRMEEMLKPAKTALEFSKRMEEALKPAKAVAESLKHIQDMFQPTFKEIFESMQEFESKWAKSISNIEMNKFSINISDFFPPDFDERIKKGRSNLQRFQTIMMKIGYPPPHDIGMPMINEIVNYYDANGTKKTRTLYLNYLEKRYDEVVINSILEKWIAYEWLEKRIPILTEAIEVHILGKYFASVTTIMPQFEGIVIDHSRLPNEHLTQTEVKEEVKKLLSSTSDFEFDQIIKNFHCNNILNKFTRGVTAKTDKNRHAILHGVDTEFGNKINSILLILQMDYIIEKIDEEKKR